MQLQGEVCFDKGKLLIGKLYTRCINSFLEFIRRNEGITTHFIYIKILVLNIKSTEESNVT